MFLFVLTFFRLVNCALLFSFSLRAVFYFPVLVSVQLNVVFKLF